MPGSLQVIRSLKRALQPAITDVSLQFKVPKEFDVLQSPQNLPPVFNGEKLVVYGILKSSSDILKKRIDCTAILKGNVLGKSQKHEVPFTLEPSEAPSLATVHHLAAKALITDWENEGKDKKSIVKLSVEASVISSHTAFIAVDEESSEPIAGAMKTYDITAHYDAFLPRSQGRGGGGGRSVGFACRSAGPHKKYLSKGRRRRKACSFSTAEIDEGEGGAHVLVSSPPTASATITSSSNITSLITAQNVDGSWSLTSVLARQFSKSLHELESACPTECKGSVASVWATVLALSLLRACYSSQQDEWELIAMKAELWLKKQSLPAGVILNQLFQEAKKII